MPELSDTQEFKIAFAMAKELNGLTVKQALRITTEVLPNLITGAYVMNNEAMVAIEERLFSGESV